MYVEITSQSRNPLSIWSMEKRLSIAALLVYTGWQEEEDGIKRSCVTNVTGLLLTSFDVIFT